MKLGEMLVRDGHVTPDQISLAIDRQRRDGGKFGTILVEMGYVDLETITMYLGLELSFPVATGAVLDRAKRTAVRLLTPEQAARLRCVPLLISERQLIIAVDDPYDVATLDEISRITGYRVIPRVAPEIRIFYYLERYYGVPRPKRYRVLGDSPRGERRPGPPSRGGPALPGPSLPGLPPPTNTPVAAPTPAPVLRASSPKPDAEVRKKPPTPPPPPPPQSVEFIEEIDPILVEADELVVELEADAADTAVEAPPAEALEAIEEARDPEHGPAYEPLDQAAARATIEEAMQRGEVADALMGFARSIFDVAVLFIVRDNLAFGWKGFGPRLTADRFEAILVPLDHPSVFQTAAKSEDLLYEGGVFPSVVHRYLYKALRSNRPDHAVVCTVSIGRRIVNILYGHCKDGAALGETDLKDLKRVVRDAAGAYVRLIAVSKKGAKARESQTVPAVVIKPKQPEPEVTPLEQDPAPDEKPEPNVHVPPKRAKKPTKPPAEEKPKKTKPKSKSKSRSRKKKKKKSS